MALNTDPWDSTELVAYISETWTPLVLEEYFAKAVAANHFTDLSQYAQAGSDIFHVPDVFTNAFSVQTQSTQATEVTTNAPATQDITLTVDTHKYVAHLLGDMDQQQVASSYDINSIYTRKIAGTLMEDLEDALFALWSGLSTNTIGDTATVVSDAEIRQAVEKMATGDFPLEECAWFFHPYVYWNQILAVQKYYDASQFGRVGVTAEGAFGMKDNSRSMMGRLYGIDIHTSSRVVSGLQTYRNLLAHPTAFGFAHQTPGGSKLRVQAANWLENLGLLTVVDTIYGVVELRDDAAVLVNASSAFIGS